MSCNAMFNSFLEIGNSIISTFGTHKIKNEVKENYKREGEVKKFSQIHLLI